MSREKVVPDSGKKKLSWGKSVPFFVPEISCPGKKVSRFFVPDELLVTLQKRGREKRDVYVLATCILHLGMHTFYVKSPRHPCRPADITMHLFAQRRRKNRNKELPNINLKENNFLYVDVCGYKTSYSKKFLS